MDTVTSDCERDALHHIGAIHPLGALVAIEVHGARVVCCSANVEQVMGIKPEQMLGHAAATVFAEQWPGLQQLADEPGRPKIEHLYRVQPRNVIAHRAGDHHILEFENGQSPPPRWWSASERIRFVERLSTVRNETALVQLLCETIAGHTGYDRVMAYRFRPDWDGEVIAEHLRPGTESFLGLRFPSGDIPENARRLYTLNWERIVADIEAEVVPLHALAGQAQPLDLTYTSFRAVHPVHIQYMRNMGVRSSLSVSLIVDGTLWGMVACHHLSSSKAQNVLQRLALEEMVRLASLHLAHLSHLRTESQRTVLRERLFRLNQALPPAPEEPSEALAGRLAQICELVDADAVLQRVGGTDYALGECPDADACAALEGWLNARSRRERIQFDKLPEPLRAYPALVKYAAGVLFIPLAGADYLLALRKEEAQQVRWAGRPSAPDPSNGKPLTPRYSFKAWRETVRYCSRPWVASELEIADALQEQLRDYLEAAQAANLAYRDPLTGLANRRAFDERLGNALANAADTHGAFALHFVDLDRFKPVNDQHGHAVGDELLRQVGARLQALARREDLVARLGGDEFALIQAHIACERDAVALAGRIVRDLAEPFDLEPHTVRIGASVGFALYPADELKSAELLSQAADVALYTAKEAGRGTFRRTPSDAARAQGA